MEQVGALSLSDNLMCSATIVDSEYDAFPFALRWVTIYWVLDLLASLMSQHNARVGIFLLYGVIFLKAEN